MLLMCVGWVLWTMDAPWWVWGAFGVRVFLEVWEVGARFWGW